MSIVKRHLAEEPLTLIEEICIDKGALVLDTTTDEVYFSADDAAYRSAYVTVLEAWASGTGVRLFKVVPQRGATGNAKGSAIPPQMAI